ncbi:MAG TPA: Sir2 family NAD-dependent protein deacetylase [Afifellaceae bacterium]|nr:Sir2 family NAD-dependent protein deacetylase [Afifellaceae bacterium]
MPAEPPGKAAARLAAWIGEAERIVAFTGAGISTESGIPDFRSPGGIWSQMRPITYQEFIASEEARLEDWRRRLVMNEQLAQAEPNAGHRALASLVRSGKAIGIVTQNIDGLHQRSGVPADRLVELHGNATRGHCLDCRQVMALDAVRASLQANGACPRCACGGLVKAAVVSFGESMPEREMMRAAEWAESSDLFLAIGSSLVVHPAASIPLLASHAGARLVIVNREATPLDEAADLVVHSSIGPLFAEMFADS